MAQRLAAAMALIAFVVCLLVGGLGADNPFGTTVVRALAAMAATFVVALVIGAMAQKMLDENLSARHRKNDETLAMKSPPGDR